MTTKISKNIQWGKTDNIYTINGEACLSGFANLGSIGSTKPIDYGNFLSFTTLFKITKNAYERAALLDIDFNNSCKTFASVVLDSRKYLSFVISDNGQNDTIFGLHIDSNNQWHKANITVENQTVSFYIDDILLSSYLYKDTLMCAKVYLGNNNVFNNIPQDSSRTSFYIKESSVKTSFGYFNCDYLNLTPMDH